MKNLDSYKIFENSKIIFSVNNDSLGNYVNNSSELFFSNSGYVLYIEKSIYKNHYYIIITDNQDAIISLKDILGLYNKLYIDNKISKKTLESYINDGIEILELVKKFTNNDARIIKSFYSKRKSKKFNL